ASLADAGRAVQSAAKTNGTAAACFKGILCSVGGCDAMSQGYASRATTGIRRQQAEPGGTRRGDGLKPGSEYTFLRAAWLRRPSDPGRAGAASQLALDGLAEAVVAENVLALERRADLPDFVRVRKRGQVHFEQCSTGCPGTGRATRRGGPGPRREVNPGPVCLAIST